MNRLTIGIISPLLDGFYYGNLHYAVHQVAQQRGIRLITVRTADQMNQELPLAFEQADGWILMRRNVSEDYLLQLQQAGKPVVVIGRPSEVSPAVQIEEQAGIFDATMHLIAHGHRHIAFIGDTNHQVMKLRFNGYLDALRRAEIEFDPNLTINPSQFHYSGGAEAADHIIEMNFPCTAAVASTDAIALGFMDRMQERGFRIPEDIAVTGFDGIAPAATYKPSLTTVEQPYAEICEAAIDRVLLAIEQPGANLLEPVILPAKLVVRNSCGCAAQALPEADTVPLQDRNIKALNYLEQVIQNNLEFSKLLFQSAAEGIEGLSELLPPGVRWGLLALWEKDRRDQTVLCISHYFHKQAVATHTEPILCTPGQFPPLDRLPEPFVLEDKEMLALIPVRSEYREWGVMVLAGEYDITRTYGNSDAMTHFFNMIAFSLEREQLFEEVRSREMRYRKIAERLELVSKATTDGIWEWDLITDRLEVNNSFRAMLDWPADQHVTIYDFIRHLHPEDREAVEYALFEDWKHKDTFEIECRLVQGEGEVIWVSCAGSCMRAAEGPPVRIIGSVRDITLNKEHEREIKFLAYHDPLTRLPNRMHFAERLHEALEHAATHHHKLALLMIDLDDFKTINDTYGHLNGDRLLQFVANNLTTTLRQEHLVARLGGDEFVILLPHIRSEKEAVEASHAILSALSRPYILVEDGTEIRISGSLGVSIYPHDGTEAETLLTSTDSAMYRAKNSGKNKVELYRADLSSFTMARSELLKQLQSGIEREELEIFYQPQIEVQSGAVFGAEALIRWRKGKSVIMPDNFIPSAEGHALIHRLGLFVLSEACKQLAYWLGEGMPVCRLSVNISARQFMEPDFADDVAGILQQYGIAPALLCLEITETSAITNVPAAQTTFAQLGALGIELSLDDFGTGYSSIQALKHYPIRYVKLDRSFVKDMCMSTRDAAMIKGLISMAHAMACKVIAEGVETEEEMNLLKQYDCDVVQGFLIDKPLPAERFAALYLYEQGIT